MAANEDIPAKIAKIKKSRDKIAKRKESVPAGAQTGALGNAPLEKTTSGLKSIFRSNVGSLSSSAKGGTPYVR